MRIFSQSPVSPDFVQNPYAFYDKARSSGELFFWQDYNRICAVSYHAVNTLLRDRRWGREIPEEFRKPTPSHIQPFIDVEAHSMLELEPPTHSRLRSLVLRAFTSRRIAGLAPEIAELSHQLIDSFQGDGIDLLPEFGEKLPVIIIARLLGVPEEMAPQLLAWSHAMVAMYQANRDREIEDTAVSATLAFSEFIRSYVDQRRKSPRDDLISQLIAAEEAGEKLSMDELITTCILLLNAGHEATVHAIGNGVKTILESGFSPKSLLSPSHIDTTIEEILRFDPPLHLFERHAYEDMTLFGHDFKRGDTVALLLAAANRDPAQFPNPNRFDPTRNAKTHLSLGAGIHFCIGGPLARLELRTALPILFDRHPGLHLLDTPRYANRYHFHGLEQLRLTL